MSKKTSQHKYFAALTLILGVGLGLCGAEIGVRAFGLAPALPNEYSTFVPDMVLPWKLKPDIVREGVSGTGEFHIHTKHNSLGFRDRDHEIEKPPGVFRIVGIGDSFTYGVGASQDATFLARIEATLSNGGGGGK